MRIRRLAGAAGTTTPRLGAEPPPARAEGLVGRHDTRQWLAAAVSGSASGPSVASLVGPPGSGTTQLALAEVARVSARGWGTVWLRGTSEASLYADLVAARSKLSGGAGPDGPDDPASGLLPALAAHERSWLVVVDDLRAPDLLLRYLPRTPGVRLVVTTSSPLARRLGPISTVGGLDPRHAAELATHGLRGRAARRLAEQLSQLFGGAPLGLILASGVLTSRDDALGSPEVRSYLERLSEARRPLMAAIDEAWCEAINADPAVARMLAAVAALGPASLPIDALTSLDADGSLTRIAGRLGLVSADRHHLAMPEPVQVAVLGQWVDDPAPVAEDAAALLLSCLSSGPLLPWLPSLQTLSGLVAVAGRACPGARELFEVAIDRLSSSVPTRLLMDLYEGRAVLTAAGLSRRDLVAWRTRRDLAVARVNGGQPEVAVTEFDSLVDEVALTLGPLHPEVLVTRCGHAVALLEAGQVDRAAKELSQLLPQLHMVCGADDPSTRRARQYRAAAHLHQGDVEAAIAELTDLVTTSAWFLGENNEEIRSLRRDLAAAYLATDRPAEALQELDLLAGPDRPLSGAELRAALSVQRVRASALARLGRTDEAIDVLLLVAPRLDAACGPKSAEALGSWRELMALYDQADRKPDAAALAERVAPAALAALGPAHPVTLRAMRRLAAARLDRQDPAAAVALLADVVAGAEGTTAAEALAEARRVLASAYRRLGDEAAAHALEAEGRDESAFERHHAVAGGDDPEQASQARRRLADVQRQAGRLGEVAELLEAEAAAAVDRFGPQHGATLLARHRQGAAMLDAERHQPAEEVLAALIRDCSTVLGSDHPLTVTARLNLASARLRTGASIAYPGGDLCPGFDPCPATGTAALHVCAAVRLTPAASAS